MLRGMRRAALTFVLLTSSLAVGARASAEDAPSPAPSVSASAPSDSAPAPAPSSPPVASAVGAPLAPVVVLPAPPAAWTPSEEDPLRFLQLLRGEADRQRAQRYFGGAVGLITGGAIASAGGFMLSDSTLPKLYAYFTIGSGALVALSSLLSLFGQNGIERLADAYEPIAEDTTLPAAKRLASGEQALRALAASEHSGRIISGVTSIVTGIILGGFAVYFALDTSLSDTNRMLFGGLIGVGGLTSIGSGVSSMTWQRGPAEIAMEHWDAARGAPHAAAGLRVMPLLAPLQGGAAVGLSLTY